MAPAFSHMLLKMLQFSVQFELSPNPDALMSELSISAGGLKDTYKFAQLHFHWGEANDDGSEHALDGRR